MKLLLELTNFVYRVMHGCIEFKLKLKTADNLLFLYVNPKEIF